MGKRLTAGKMQKLFEQHSKQQNFDDFCEFFWKSLAKGVEVKK